MSTQLAESIVGTAVDLALETPPDPEPTPDDPAPDPEPDAPELSLAPAADLDDLFDDDPADEAVSLEALDDLTEDELRAQLVKTTRAAEHERRLRVQTGMKAWRAEAEQRFPYSQPQMIQAESRREFLRLAQAADQAFRAQAQPLLDQFKKREQTLETRLRAEIRAEFEKGWGPVTLGGPGAPQQTLTSDRLAEARKRRSLVGAARALMDGGNI